MELFDEFNYSFERGLEVTKMSSLSYTERKYARLKKDALIKLMNELESLNFLKNLTKEDIIKLDKNMFNVLTNVGHIRDLYQTFLKMTENDDENLQETEINLKDIKGKTYSISTYQIVIIAGWSYCSFCEFMRQWFMEFVDFSKMKGKQPKGIGEIVKILKDNKIQNLDFFSDIDTRLRNSFFHVNFRLDGNKIYCENMSEIHAKNLGRLSEHNNQSKYITIEDLLWAIIHVDRSNYSLMHFWIYLVKHSK